MKKKVLLLGIVVVVMCLKSSVTLALDPMGPPTADLKKGKFSAGSSYSYSKMNLKLTGGKYSDSDGDSGVLPSIELEDFKINKVYADLGYEIADRWDIFLRLGSTKADFKYEYDDAVSKFDSGTDFAIGLGAKTTFWQKGKLELGTLFQISWTDFDGRVKGGDSTGEEWSDTISINLTEIQVAIGPSYQLTNKICLYGGPFFHFIDGELSGKGNALDSGGGDKYSWDIHRSGFGGYVGTQVNVAENIYFNIEYQHTATADGLGMSLIWQF